MDQDMEDVDRKEEELVGEEYDENADEDFNPDQAKDDSDNSESSSEDDDHDGVKTTAKRTKKQKPAKGKRNLQDVSQEAQLDSGDEATIRERKAKRRKKNTVTHDEDSGGEGGFIRTRRQRAVEREERKNRKRGVREGAVTIDVDKIWAELSSVPVGRTALPPLLPTNAGGDDMDVDEDDKENAIGGEMVTIKRRSQYAGEITYIEVQVPRNCKEARRYFEEHPELDPHRTADQIASTAEPSASTTQRPLRRPSMFEPNPTGLVKGVAPEKLRLRAPSRMDVLMAQKRAEAKKSAQKLSTMQMSQYDWKSYVEKEGLKDELDVYERSGNRFLAKEAFLDRAAGAREAAARDARLKL